MHHDALYARRRTSPSTVRLYDALYHSSVDSPLLSGVCLVSFPCRISLLNTDAPVLRHRCPSHGRKIEPFRPWLVQWCQKGCSLLRCTRTCLLVAFTSRWVSVRGFHASLPNSTGTTAQLPVRPLSANVSLTHQAKHKKQSEAQVTTHKESQKKDREWFVCA